MLGQPEAVKAEPLGVLSEIARAVESFSGIAALGNGGEVEHREGDGHRGTTFRSVNRFPGRTTGLLAGAGFAYYEAS
jgi:hypothetical protein